LRHQAAALVNAGLPSKRSIRRDYTRQEGDVAGFSSALVSLLKGEQGTAGQAYGSAIAQQQAIDDAARQQLGNLGEAYGPGSAVKVGATGDSAVSSLLGGQAAAADYASRQPGIAAGRGALGQEALQNALSDALRQRDEQFHQGYGPALQQVTQADQDRALAIANLGITQQQLRDSEAAQAFSESNAQASLAERHNEFAYTHSPAYLRMVAHFSGSGSGNGLSAFTPNEIQGYRSDIADVVDAAKSGVPAKDATGKVIPGQWKVPPAPNGAPREPGQKNSILALYDYLTRRYPKPLVLAELRASYPNAAWAALVRQEFPRQWRQLMFADVNRAARQAGRAPWGRQKGPRRG
jgi:hypothetical protein